MQTLLPTNPDATFLSLLTSQRELLNRLNAENRARRAELGLPVSGSSATALSDRSSANMMATTNRAIQDFHLPGESLASRRLSMGLLDGGFSNLPPFPTNADDDERPDITSSKLSPKHADEGSILASFSVDFDSDLALGKRDKLDAGADYPRFNKKRRLSSLGFLSSSFFEEHAVVKPTHRHPLDEIPIDDDVLPPCEDEEDVVIEVIVDGDADSDDEEQEGKEDEQVQAMVAEESGVGERDEDELNDEKSFDLSPSTLEERMAKITEAMNSSMESQLAIHKWDRKMGLKRSHSKTMRLSTRSRKKLSLFFKKEISKLQPSP